MNTQAPSAELNAGLIGYGEVGTILSRAFFRARSTVREAGFEPWMSAATAEKQDWIAALAKSGAFRELASDCSWRDYADWILSTGSRARALKSK